MPYQIIGSIRDGLNTFEGLLPENHGIKPERLQSFIDAGLLEEVEVIRKKKPKPEPTIARQGAFDLDPDGLVGLDVERLNAMIAERGGTAKFGEAKQAAAYLSKDFNPAAAKAKAAKAPKKLIVWEDEATGKVEPAPLEVQAAELETAPAPSSSAKVDLSALGEK